ncbi:cell division cycle protein 123 [Moelleriella libera RCEF 2490]|uniref:Cell division cycle protein 123 n=1 Tax=Moelleriella libera RCEF 2490 TaxID=1081109 RepID=A0A166U4H7_9HYPO|nr:cell division cycle protein 123 [Moelleriella libera RCEF 2490]
MPHLPPGFGSNSGDGREPVFPPVTKDHIQNCSYDAWFSKYRSSSLKSKIIPLPQVFVAYLQEDGILLADEDSAVALADPEWHSAGAMGTPTARSQDDSSDEDSEDEAVRLPPNQRFPDVHEQIKKVIVELGGAVAPKLNWSAPKDAKWVSPHQNTLKCTSPNDIYLLLKSSSFVSHDLDHAFDGCTPAPPSRPFAPVLVLRPFFTPHVALEFRCFVKHRSLIGISQRDLNYYAFLSDLLPHLRNKINKFFMDTLRLTFPDACFTFDVYLPEDPVADDGLGRVRLMDINPWAPRTDSLLFSWQELLDADVKAPLYGSAAAEHVAELSADETAAEEADDDVAVNHHLHGLPELRIIEKDDPAAFNFSSPQYSAHKLPREVVDASMAGEGGLREFAQQWKEITEGRASGLWDHQRGQRS